MDPTPKWRSIHKESNAAESLITLIKACQLLVNTPSQWLAAWATPLDLRLVGSLFTRNGVKFPLIYPFKNKQIYHHTAFLMSRSIELPTTTNVFIMAAHNNLSSQPIIIHRYFINHHKKKIFCYKEKKKRTRGKSLTYKRQPATTTTTTQLYRGIQIFL